MRHAAALPVAWIALRILSVANWLLGAAILALLVASLLAEQWTFTALGVAPPSQRPAMIMGMRAIMALGLVGILLNQRILKRLRAMVETVRRGDPFVAANAERLNAIAWTLLGLQLLSLAIGGVGEAISTPETPVRLDAGFSASGWLAVILTFVLARVFAEGTLMREDLEGTV